MARKKQKNPRRYLPTPCTPVTPVKCIPKNLVLPLNSKTVTIPAGLRGKRTIIRYILALLDVNTTNIKVVNFLNQKDSDMILSFLFPHKGVVYETFKNARAKTNPPPTETVHALECWKEIVASVPGNTIPERAAHQNCVFPETVMNHSSVVMWRNDVQKHFDTIIGILVATKNNNMKKKSKPNKIMTKSRDDDAHCEESSSSTTTDD